MPRGVYPKSKEYWEKWRKIRTEHIVTKTTRKKIGKSLKKTYALNPPTHAHLHARKGKTLEEIYGIEKANAIKEKSSKANTGRKYGPPAKAKINRYRRTMKLKKENGWVSPNKGKTYEEIHGEKKAKQLRQKLSLVHVNNPRPVFNQFKRGYYQSKYNGRVWYRSSYELAVMQYLDRNNIKWEYEGKENIFHLNTINKFYLNDFYLPKEDKYIQVKGYQNKNDKFPIFKQENPQLNIELWNDEVLKDKGIL